MANIVPMQTVVPMRPRDYNASQLATIRQTLAADCSGPEFDLYMEVSRRVGLDPFRKQIYAVVYNKDKPAKRKMSIITAIDGFRSVAARNGDYRPDENEPDIIYSAEAKDPKTNPLGIVKATVRTFKYGKDQQWHPVSGWAYWNEYAPITERWAEIDGKWSPTGEFELDKRSNWYRMPHVMLPKCAEAQSLRKGWPEDLSGLYSPEEMDKIILEATASEAVEQHQTQLRLARVGAKDTVPILWEAGQPIEAVPVGEMVDRVAKHLAASDSLTGTEIWRDANRIGLQQLWGYSKSDGLEVKRMIEDKLTELAKA